MCYFRKIRELAKEAIKMIKVAIIGGLIIVGILAAKFLDEKAQKKVVIGLCVLVAVAALSLVISELIR